MSTYKKTAFIIFPSSSRNKYFSSMTQVSLSSAQITIILLFINFLEKAYIYYFHNIRYSEYYYLYWKFFSHPVPKHHRTPYNKHVLDIFYDGNNTEIIEGNKN